jgi:hypothetical protein
MKEIVWNDDSALWRIEDTREILLKKYPIENKRWNYLPLPTKGTPGPRVFWTYVTLDDNDPKLDPWNRKILPWREYNHPGPQSWKWNYSDGEIQWRYTSVEGKLVDIYIVYR